MAFDSATGPELSSPARGGKPRRRGVTSMIDFGPDTFGWTGGERGIRNVLEADPYRFPQQHVQLLRDFGPEANLANITPGQILRLEGFRRGIGRAVNYSLLSGDAMHAAGSRT